jgi:hypothetical protein
MILLNTLIIPYPQVKHDSKQGCRKSAIYVIAIAITHNVIMHTWHNRKNP